MKTVVTVGEIFKQFNNLNDKVFIKASKYYGYFPQYDFGYRWVLKDGVLYHDGEIIGKCNSDLGIQINYYRTDSLTRNIFYDITYKDDNTKILTFFLDRDFIFTSNSDIGIILLEILASSYCRVVADLNHLISETNKNRFANINYLYSCYKTNYSQLKYVKRFTSDVCMKHGLNRNQYVKTYLNRKVYWCERNGNKISYNNINISTDTDNTKLLTLNKRIKSIVECKIFYWNNFRKGIYKDKKIPYKTILSQWQDPIKRKELIETTQNDVKIDKQAKAERLKAQRDKYTQQFNNFEINVIPYSIMGWRDVIIRYNEEKDIIECSKGYSINKSDFIEIAEFVKTCFYNNVTLSPTDCNVNNFKLTDSIRINNVDVKKGDIEIILNYIGYIKLDVNNVYNIINKMNIYLAIPKTNKREIIKKYSRNL